MAKIIQQDLKQDRKGRDQLWIQNKRPLKGNTDLIPERFAPDRFPMESTLMQDYQPKSPIN